MAWIDVHIFDNGDCMTINTNDIRMLRKNGRIFTEIVFRVTGEYIRVKESHEQIKKLIKEAEHVGKRYKHYKGGLYEVLCEAKHTEQEEELVIYRSVETGAIWARPKEMFFQKVFPDGPEGVPRFREVDR